MSCFTVRSCTAMTVRKRITPESKEANRMKMINAKEIVELRGVSKATAYKIIRHGNAELEESGCRTV